MLHNTPLLVLWIYVVGIMVNLLFVPTPLGQRFLRGFAGTEDLTLEQTVFQTQEELDERNKDVLKRVTRLFVLASIGGTACLLITLVGELIILCVSKTLKVLRRWSSR